jgi:hypothetical protein
MYQTICVPFDAALAGSLAPLAQQMARAFGAQPVGLWIDHAARARARARRLSALLPDSAELAPASSPETATTPDLGFPMWATPAASAGELITALGEARAELVVLDSRLGSLVERVLGTAVLDTLVVRDPSAFDGGDARDTILCCIDGSQQSYAGLESAIALAQRFHKKLEAVGVYDPYLHYTLFNGIVNVLSEEASRVFKFKDQEKLHEEIIDTGLAKIYQAHLEVAQGMCKEAGVDLTITLLDGKAFSKIAKHVEKRRPWLCVLGRVGVHSAAGPMDIGATTENLLRTLDSNFLITSRTTVPPMDLRAEAAIEWTPAAEVKMARVPEFVRGVARTAIMRWATERGHSIITESVINSAMGDLLPPQAAQAMGYVAEAVAIDKDRLADGKTFLCPSCGHAARDFRPTGCPVCRTPGTDFELIDRAALQKLGSLEKGVLEEAFDGKRLVWTEGAKEILHRVPSGYERRRSKARMEKTARVRGLEVLTREFALDVVEQDLADTSYLSPAGEKTEVKVVAEERPDDLQDRPREGSAFTWTNAAWTRLGRVPLGFMREMTRERVEGFAKGQGREAIDLALCESGIAEGRRMMAEMLGQYSTAGKSKEEVRDTAKQMFGHGAGAPVAIEAPAPAWTPEAVSIVETAATKVADLGKFTDDRARELAQGVAEERARDKKLEAIGEAFMKRLGVQLGYGHPLSEKTAEHQFTWTPEAEARLQNVPDFCREMTRWRVEWTAVKRDLGRVITPDIMDLKFDMWGDVSQAIRDRGGPIMDWAPETMARLERVPEFVKGQVIQSVEGNAQAWGLARVDNAVMDRVIDKWIATGDFHEARYGYK